MPNRLPGLRDDLPMDEWQRVRGQQVDDPPPAGGTGQDHLSLRPSQLGSPQQGDLRGAQAAASLFGRAADVVSALTGRRASPEPKARAASAAQPPPQKVYTKRDAALDLGAKHLLERIAIGEHDGHPVSYDTTYGYGAFVPPGSKKITEMTFDEVAVLQAEMLRRQDGRTGVRSRPIGKYQFMPDTLDRVRRKLGLKGTDVLTPGVQDMLARELLAERGYDAFLAGRMDAATFQANLASEWASVAHPKTGRSRWGTQPVGTSTEQLQSAFAEARAEADRRIKVGANPNARGWR